MTKNIIIAVLVVVSLGSIVFAFYNQTLAEKAMSEVVEQRELAIEAQQMAISNGSEAEKQQKWARIALEEANIQRMRAEEALKEAQKQREIALSKCK